MIIVSLEYTASLEEIDMRLAAHRAWLQAAVTSGRLMVAGRRVPRTGGMLIARGTMEEIMGWAATDPFADVARYSFIEIDPTIVAPGLEALAAS
ncbi:YciI family protein [Aquisediminimonas profunda]|uniref:YciI family protein n=1 Tax=Aquisediminimonas profunda TaxID=1550733 RepID=UPI001C6381A5|nr:YciI family protein [Aquisediminimonas profunda]